MTLSTYTHEIRASKGCRLFRQRSRSTEPALPVDAWWTSPAPRLT